MKRFDPTNPTAAGAVRAGPAGQSNAADPAAERANGRAGQRAARQVSDRQ